MGPSSVKWTKVHEISDQSTGETLETFGTVGPFMGIRMWHTHTCTTFDVSVHVKTAKSAKMWVWERKSALINIHKHYKILTKPGTVGKRSLNYTKAKSCVPACVYRHFRLRGVSKPKFSKVGQSTPGFGSKYRGAIRNIWYRGALRHSNFTYLHHIRRFSVKTAVCKKWAWHHCIYFRIKVRFFLGDPFT